MQPLSGLTTRLQPQQCPVWLPSQVQSLKSATEHNSLLVLESQHKTKTRTKTKTGCRLRGVQQQVTSCWQPKSGSQACSSYVHEQELTMTVARHVRGQVPYCLACHANAGTMKKPHDQAKESC